MSLLSILSVAVLSSINSSLDFFAFTLSILKKYTKKFSLTKTCFNSRLYKSKCGLSLLSIMKWEDENCGSGCLALLCLPYLVPLLLSASIDCFLLAFLFFLLVNSGILLINTYLIFGMPSFMTEMMKSLLANCIQVTLLNIKSKEYLHYTFLRCVHIFETKTKLSYLLSIIKHLHLLS